MSSSLIGDTLTTGKIVLTNTTSNNDAFDRFRVSQPFTLFDFNSIMGKMPTRFDERITGGATSTYNTKSYIQLTVDTSGSSSVIRQTKQYIPYLPGKSKLVILTGIILTSASTTGVSGRIGTFDASGGHFFQMTDGVVSVVERKDDITDIVINQSSWNVDKLDGTGPSGLTIDFTKATIYIFDQEWLGVGRIRMGIMIAGYPRFCHYFLHDPILGSSSNITEPYYRFATLPIRYEIIKTVDGGTVGEMRMMCGSVISEGGYIPIVKIYTNGTYITPIGVNSTTWQPILSISLQTDTSIFPYNRTNIRIHAISVVNVTGNSFLSWQLVSNPTFTGTDTSVWTNVGGDSAARIRIHDSTARVSTWSEAYISEFLGNKATTSKPTDFDILSRPVLSSDISGNPDIFTLIGVSFVGNSSVLAAFDWSEYI